MTSVNMSFRRLLLLESRTALAFIRINLRPPDPSIANLLRAALLTNLLRQNTISIATSKVFQPCLLEIPIKAFETAIFCILTVEAS